MADITLSLAPIFLLILLGYGLRKKGFVPGTFWEAAEKMTYFIFFPALLVSNTASAGFGGIKVLPMALALIGGVLVVSGGMVVARHKFAIPGAQFTSLFQGGFRPNTYVAIATALSLFGEAGLTLIALAIVIVVPTVNFLSVMAFARYAPKGEAVGVGDALSAVARNPLIIACLVGAVLNGGGVGMPPLIGPILEILGRAALPVGLLAVGAGLNFSAARRSDSLVAAATLCKLVALPLITFVLCKLLDVSGLTATVSVLYAASPGSPSSYVLAKQMGGDAKLMAAIITATTLAAMISMPLVTIFMDSVR